jgi:tartrate-resistant acid phosphatase type 5
MNESIIRPGCSSITPGAGVTRRRALQIAFAFSASSVLTHGQEEMPRARRGRGRPDTALPAAGPASPPPPAARDDQHVMIWGDWGADGRNLKAQTAVATGMGRYTKSLGVAPACQFLLGDNFYGRFKDGVRSPRWKQQFEDMYPAAIFPGPCHALLGNHDYDDSPGTKIVAQLQYARANPGTRWSLPANWYSFILPVARSTPLAKCIVLDSNYKNRLVSISPDERARQLQWFKDELEMPRSAPWLIVMAHHPLYSQGQHGDHKALINDWGPLLRQHRVHLYLAGHDHDLQHLEFEGHPTSFVISGAGGARAYARELEKAPKGRGPYAQTIYGFSHLQINRERFVLHHLDANGKLLYSFTKTPDARMQILARA